MRDKDKARTRSGQGTTPDASSRARYDIAAKLREVLDNPRAPPQARAAAGRTLAEIDGLIGRHQLAPARGAVVPVGQLSRSELEAELGRLRDKVMRDKG